LEPAVVRELLSSAGAAGRYFKTKANGGARPLGGPTVADRIAPEGARRYFEPILEPGFYPHSYFYRPSKSAIDALDESLQSHSSRKMAFYGREPDRRRTLERMTASVALRCPWFVRYSRSFTLQIACRDLYGALDHAFVLLDAVLQRIE